MDSIRKRLAVAVTLLAGGLVAAALPAQAAQAAPTKVHGGSFTLPEGAPVPEGNFRIKRSYKVVAGVQEYTCTAAGVWSTPTSTPEAWLVRYSGLGVIHHYAGPRWTALDGSTVVLDVRVTSLPKDGTIPWLLLKLKLEKGKPGQELSNVTHVSRVNTTGGVGPTGACAAGASQKVPYGADYVFWVPV